MKRFPPPFHKRNFNLLSSSIMSLKTEDKILLGIGGGFLIGVLLFIIGASTIFTSLRTSSPSSFQQLLLEREQAIERIDKMFEKSALEFQEEFQRFHEAFEQSRKEDDAMFQEAVKNFQDRFDKASQNFRK